MVAVIISVTVLLFVGEIVPQALCTGPNQMKIASFLAPFTYILMWITYPISYPIAIFMDYVIGVWEDEQFTYSSLGNVLTADYIYKYEGEEYEHVVTNYTYEYDGKYPVKVTATIDGEPYFTRYYEY